MQPLVVLAPHPDDELLGAAGIMARALQNGQPVGVIILTDGSHSDPSINPEILRELRREEARAGLATMLGKTIALLFLDAEDGQLDCRAVDISEGGPLGTFMSAFGGAALLVTDPADGHPDHKAAFGLASRLISAGFGDRLDVMPISQRVDGTFVADGYQAFPLADLAPRKADALACHQSQISSTTGFSLSSKTCTDFMQTEYSLAIYDRIQSKNQSDAVPASHFDALFTQAADPWGYDHEPYEADRFRRTVNALDGRFYANALEMGCANGALTAQLAPHCAQLISVDTSVRALDLARQRLAMFQNVRFATAALPDDLPNGNFDLIVASDFLYYLGFKGVVTLTRRIDERATADCRLVMANYLGPTECALSGEMAAEIVLAHLPNWQCVSGDRTDRLRIDVMERR